MKRARPLIAYLSLGRRPGAIPVLDGLRAIAILLVLMRHAVRPIVEEHGALLTVGSWDLATPFLNGWMGVDLFFVLSGFLITYHLLRRWPEKFDLVFAARYWSKRVLRTFPAYYAAVGIAWFGLVPMFSPQVDDPGHTLYVHGFFLQDYFGSYLVPAFWSLGVEEKFYLVCPLVLIWFHRQKRTTGLAALLALALLPLVLRVGTVLVNGPALASYDAFFWQARAPFHLAMDGLWIGVICALLYVNDVGSIRGNHTLARRLFWASFVTVVSIMVAAPWFDGLHFLASAIVLNLIAFAFGGLLLSVVVGGTPVDRLLSAAWLRVISVLSYSAYLVHLMVVPLALHITSGLVATDTAGPIVHFLVFLPVFSGLSLVAGTLLHWAIEKPFLLLKDRVQLRPQTATRPSPAT